MEDMPQGQSGHHSGNRGLLPGGDPDETLAVHLRVLREQAGLTQRQLADQMTLLGYKMHQTTIAKIEAPEASDRRPVTVGEAVALAHVLGVDLAALITHPTRHEAARAKLAEVMVKRNALLRTVANLEAEQAAAADSLARARAELDETVAHAAALESAIARKEQPPQ